MATRNIVPRADGEGKLGTTAKKWGEVHAGAVAAESVTSTGAVKTTGITTRQNSTAYAVEDVAFSASIPGKLVLQCTTAGTTAASEPDMSGAAAGGTVTDGTVVWTYKTIVSNYASRGLDNLTQDGEDHFLGDDNFTIIYPNNGTASNPANITYNSRYSLANPFPGYRVACVAELYENDVWGETGWFSDTYDSSNRGFGTSAFQLNDNTIEVVTGNSGIAAKSGFSGGSFASGILTAPCRVKVWKIGKVANS